VSGGIFHAATAAIAVPATQAFKYLSDGLRQGEWTLGSWNREQLEPGLFRGVSLFDGRETYVRILANRDALLVDYDVGRSRDRLLRVNSARIVPGPLVGRADGTCVLALMKWRAPDQSDDEWEQAVAAFSAEIHMIKGRLELGF